MFLIKKEAIDCDIQAIYNAINLFINTPSIVSKRICGCDIVKWGKLKNFDEQKILESEKICVLNDSSSFWEEFEANVGEFNQISVADLEEKESVVVVVCKILPKKVDRNTNVWTINFIGK